VFGSKQAHDTESHATAAWNELVEALGSTRDSASERAKGLSHEAGRRAGAAWDVLAGRPAPTRAWPMIRAMAIGVAAGWVAAEFARRRRPEIERTLQRSKEVVGTELKQAKHNIDERIAKAKATPGGPVEKAKAAVNSSTGS
jgi:hypothetical protein